MKITAIAIDDEPFALKDLEDECANIPYLDLKHTCSSLLDAKAYLFKNGKVDIIFCDIDMPDIDGLMAADLLRGQYRQLVYITGFEEKAREAFAVYADGFLTKPVSYTEILPLLDKPALKSDDSKRDVPEKNTEEIPEKIFVKNDKEDDWRGVPLSDVTKLTAAGNYVKVFAPHFIGMEHMTMNETAEFLPQTHFMRTNQSTIVAFRAIERIDRNLIYVKGDEHPIKVTEMGRKAFEEFLKRTHLSRG